jgi:anti-sigma factor RsiW
MSDTVGKPDAMNCKRCAELLLEYADNGLDASTKQSFEQHMGHCECCRILMATYQKTSKLCCSALKAKVPHDVEARVLSFLKSKLSRPNSH